MNGLTLRISKGGGKKSRSSLSCAPLMISNFVDKTLCDTNALFRNFLQSATAEEQLAILKAILNEKKSSCDDVDIINFLVLVFFHAEAKHPVKCFLTRHITKSSTIQNQFSNCLGIQISSSITNKHSDYKDYVIVVSKVASCVENFPAGAAAVKGVELDLAYYLKWCLECCVEALREIQTLSPTEKNEIFNLAHLALRLLLHIIQKISTDNICKLTSMFNEVRIFMKELVYDEDVPMDTKSVCGIVYLSMRVLENGPNSWIDILKPDHNDEYLSNLLANDAAQLALHSAIVIVVSAQDLQLSKVDGESAIIALILKMLAIGERSSSESTFILGVTRTLVQISKTLDKIADNAVGLKLVDCLLIFIWGHLEHYMDSVRHLTAQAMGYVVRYCTGLKTKGDDKALSNLFAALAILDRSRKSYYVSLSALTVELGAVAILDKLPTVICDVMGALDVQAIQASATTALEILLEKYIHESSTGSVYHSWVEPILSHVATNTLDSGVLNILENLLAKAVKLDDNVINYMLPHIKTTSDPKTQTHDLKCILMLLSVARKSGVTEKLSSERNEEEWKGIISYEVLEMAAVDAVEETRILSLSLIVECPKSTEMFTRGDLQFILCYLKYNINAQSPNFRQLTLSMMKKFIKRFEDSHKVLKRQRELQDDYYTGFLEDLREQCFNSLIPGSNYSRRFVALQMLVWCEQLYLEGYDRTWNEYYVERLLLHLEDSYENNKSFALDVLEKCPVELLMANKYSISLDIEDILQQATCLKPTECISAAYKLNLLWNKLPDYILQGKSSDITQPVMYALLHRLQSELRRQLAVCAQSIISAAVHAPMYGILHCMVHLIMRVEVSAISNADRWTALMGEIITTCIDVNAAVACVVNNSSPEGHLPMDMTGVVVTDHGNSGGVRLEDGRQVTAQMVLLCAWRSVKEVSLLLGEISSRLSIVEEGESFGTLTHAQLSLIGEHFTSLLAETKHRGAFEQAYVGFTKLLARLWRCRSPALHELPRAWLAELMATIASGDKRGTLCATRRSAGLPFMIQALVTTELQVQGNPKCFHHCMSTLLMLADTSTGGDTCVSTRTHCINILRALFRNAALDESGAGHAGRGLMVALRGFEGGTWAERNSCTLLFSALMVRVFGVQRSRDADRLCVRNRMTGRIFFMRYPELYDFMLDKLKEVSSSDDTQLLRPSLYPVLLLLARLYPSSLEGTVSNLKLVAYIPHVLSCAKSSVLKTRQLAAKAMVPLISPEQYISHVEAMLQLICDNGIKRNYCHGILLQLVRLLDARPDSLIIETEATCRLQYCISNSLWILQQAVGDTPCYLLADEYVKVVNLIIWKFPDLVHQEIVNTMEKYLYKLLFDSKLKKIISGRDICLANALYLYFIILSKYDTVENACELVYKSLSHESYEVILSTLNYLLILYDELSLENNFQENLSAISNRSVLKNLRDNSIYMQSLCKVLKNNVYLECIQKTLKVLTLEKDTQKYIVEMKTKETLLSDEIVITTLFDCIQNEHENLTHIYLESLSHFITKKLQNLTIDGHMILDVIRMIFACSSSDNSDDTRSVVVGFLENNSVQLMKMNFDSLSEEDKFEYKATLLATIVRVLEDDDATLRQRTSDVITRLSGKCDVIPNKAAEVLRDTIAKDEGLPMFTVLALLDFQSEVCMTDETNDECRVFDQNERYNIFLEETVWTNECADNIIRHYSGNIKLIEYIQTIIDNPVYRKTFDKLCNDNLVLFETIVKERNEFSNKAINPKVRLFVNRIRDFSR